MENIDFNVKRELMNHAKSMTDINECRQWCIGWCEEHHENFTDVWYGFVRQAFLWGEEARMRERCIQAVKNTLKYFPTLDLIRMEHWNDEDIKKHIEIYEANGEWKVKKIFGVEIRVDNPGCCCFALRCSETHKRNDGVEYEWLQLLTTFDFETVKIDDKERAQRAAAQYQSQQHEFVVYGEKIVANNRKTALKIYEKRHPELKRKKK